MLIFEKYIFMLLEKFCLSFPSTSDASHLQLQKSIESDYIQIIITKNSKMQSFKNLVNNEFILLNKEMSSKC